MSVYFFDSSAVVKRYLKETGTAWVSAVANPTSGNRIYLARITLVEAVAAIARKVRGGGLSSTMASKAITEFRQDFATEYLPINLSLPLIQHASEIAEGLALRGYDAVQLAAALEVNAERLSVGLPAIILVSADTALNTAAAAEGLAAEDPNAHP